MTKQTRRRPAFEAAAAYVLQLINAKQIGRLPPVRLLAKKAGVSVTIMCAAIAALRKRGDLPLPLAVPAAEKLRGRPFGADTIEPPARSGIAYRHLLHDIIRGRYNAGPFLPSCKELCETYGISFATLKRALTALIDNAIIERRAKHYHVRHAPARVRAGTRVLLVVSEGLQQFMEKFAIVRTRMTPLIRDLEHECSRRNLRLIIRPFQRDPRAFEDCKDVIGSSVLLGPHFPPVEQSDTLVRSLLELKRPVFLFDGRRPEAYSDLPDNSNLYFVQELSYRAGYDMANLLINQGHRRVGFFTHGPEPFWSTTRRLAMEKAYESAGFSNAVVLLRAGPVWHKDGIFIDASENNPTVTSRMKEQARYVQAQIDHFERAFDPSPFRQRVLGEMQEMRVQLSGVWSRFVPLCEQALAMHDITAWVAGEDQIAVYSLLPFLASRKMSVPRDISIVGFNNIPEAIGAGLTTYDFNVPGLVSAAIDLFLFPERRRHYIDPSTQEVAVKGYIIDRGSIGPPKARNRPDSGGMEFPQPVKGRQPLTQAIIAHAIHAGRA